MIASSQLIWKRKSCRMLQMMFGQDVTVAVQDPSYPVYVDSSVIMGMTGGYNESKKAFNNIQYMPCTADNGFFPDLSKVSEKHVQLQGIVSVALAGKKIIV